MNEIFVVGFIAFEKIKHSVKLFNAKFWCPTEVMSYQMALIYFSNHFRLLVNVIFLWV
jgi:hypothetical protein